MSPRATLNAELNYIFQKLFWNFDEIWITRLTPGYSGAGVFMVTPDYGPAIARPVVVKIGLKEKIQIEEINYNDYVKWLIGGMRSTNLMASAYSNSLGGIVYSLIGNPMDRGIISFENYYNSNDIKHVGKAVERLFNSTCISWYQKIANRQDDIFRLYKRELFLDLNKVIDNYKKLFPVFYANNRVIYPGINYYFIDLGRILNYK